MLRAVFAICVLCFGLAIYSGHRIVSETQLHRADEPSLVPGMPKSPRRDTIAALEQEQRIRAARLTATGVHTASAFQTIMDALNGR